MHKTETQINIQLSHAQIRQLNERGYTFLILPDTGEIKRINYDDLIPVTSEPEPESSKSSEEMLSELDELLQKMSKILQKSTED